MTDTLPTVVLVHGAWHTPYHYQVYIDALRAQGFTVYCPHLPSSNGSSPPTASFAEDVACVRSTIKRLVEAGQKILLIMHSYGGAVGTDAVQDLTITERKEHNESGGVIHLLYLCAYLLQPHGSIYQIMESLDVAHLWPQFMDDAADGTSFPKDPGLWFYGGVDKKVIDEELVPRLVRLPLSVIHAKTSGDAWKRLPVTYVFTTDDYSVPRSFQDLMIDRVRSEQVDLVTVECDSSHSPFITKTQEMVRVAVGAAEDPRNLK